MNKPRQSSHRMASAILVAIASIGFASSAMAQDRDHRGGPQEHRDAPRGGPDHGPRQDARGHDDRGDRGAGPDHNFRRGGRLPNEYRDHTYVVDDWRNHQLTAPPRGYHWVQTGPDYVLAAIATGVIAQVLLGN